AQAASCWPAVGTIRGTITPPSPEVCNALRRHPVPARLDRCHDRDLITGTRATGCDCAATGARLASAADPPSARFGACAVTHHRRGAAREDHLGGRLRLGRPRATLARHSEHAPLDVFLLEAYA